MAMSQAIENDRTSEIAIFGARSGWTTMISLFGRTAIGPTTIVVPAMNDPVFACSDCMDS